MSYWALRIGLTLIVIGLILLSPIGDFLPVDFWPRLKNFFFPDPLSSKDFVFRFVPGEQSRTLEFALIGVGILFVASALYFGPKK